MAADQRFTVPAPGDRDLDVLMSGPEDGLALVFHTGTPSGLVGSGPGLDWLAGMAEENVEEFRAALAGSSDLTTFLDAAAGLLRGIRAADVAKGLGALISPADQAVLTGEFAEYLTALLRAALTSGIDGWRDDDLAFTRDWGLSLEALGHATPVAIWQGDQDRMVPSAHGDWLAANIPLARARLLPGEGHLTLIAQASGRILDDLMDLAGVKPGTRPRED